MNGDSLSSMSVREMEPKDIERVVSYFVDADADFLLGMGADKSKLPTREKWVKSLRLELSKPYSEKSYYYIIWCLDGQPVGHSNVNLIEYGRNATMHLHLWQNRIRKKGLGFNFLRMTIPLFFEKLKLQKLICEPFAENIAPNRALKKMGFDFIKTYETKPGPINLLQFVNRYELRRDNLPSVINSNKE